MVLGNTLIWQLPLWALISAASVFGETQLQQHFDFEAPESVEFFSYAEESGQADQFPAGDLLHSESSFAGSGSLEIRKLANGIARVDARSPCYAGRLGAEVRINATRLATVDGYRCAVVLLAYRSAGCSGEPAISFRDEGGGDAWSDVRLVEPLRGGRPHYRWGLWATGTPPGSCLFDEVSFTGPLLLPAPVPTVGPAGLFALASLLVGIGLWRLRYRGAF